MAKKKQVKPAINEDLEKTVDSLVDEIERTSELHKIEEDEIEQLLADSKEKDDITSKAKAKKDNSNSKTKEKSKAKSTSKSEEKNKSSNVKNETEEELKKEKKKEKEEKKDNEKKVETEEKSKVNKEEDLESTKTEILEIDIDKTNKYDFEFDEDRLSSTDTLDTSFLEGRIKSTVEKDKDTYNKELNIDNEKTKLYKEKPKTNHQNIKLYMLSIILLLVGGVLGFIICSNFFPRIETVTKIKKVVEEKKIVDDNYLFLGDSITDYYDLDKYFEELPTVNSGSPGNTTDDILKDMKDRVYQYNPSKIFLLIGTNDYEFSNGNESIEENVTKIIDEIQENRPLAEIYIESIYPVNRNESDKHGLNMNKNHNNENIEQANEMLREIAKEKNSTYIDLYSILYNEEDEGLKLDYSKDGLHISDKGYEVITKELKKYLN